VPPASLAVQLAHPTLIARPFHREGWVYEEKVDGWRMLAYKVAGTVKLVSRSGRDHTSRFPGIVAALRKLRHGAHPRRRGGGVRRATRLPIRVAPARVAA